MKKTISIGIDFDNTIVNHDAVFYKYARKKGLIHPGVSPTKLHVGLAIKKLPDGNRKWTELQGWVYAEHMQESVPMEGVTEFFAACTRRAIPIAIVSHRTKQPVIGPDSDLRESSLRWLDTKEFFDRYGLSREKVYFTDTLDDKVELIGKLGFTHFIDDLTLVLKHGKFPKKVRKIYLNRHGRVREKDILHAQNWTDVMKYFFGSDEIY